MHFVLSESLDANMARSSCDKIIVFVCATTKKMPTVRDVLSSQSINPRRAARNASHPSLTVELLPFTRISKFPNNHVTILERERERERKGNPVHISLFPIYAPICSAVCISEPTNVTMRRLLMLVISSGTSQMVAPILRAIEMASLALAYISSSVRPGATRS
jgi:hypothetical protein